MGYFFFQFVFVTLMSRLLNFALLHYFAWFVVVWKVEPCDMTMNIFSFNRIHSNMAAGGSSQNLEPLNDCVEPPLNDCVEPPAADSVLTPTYSAKGRRIVVDSNGYTYRHTADSKVEMNKRHWICSEVSDFSVCTWISQRACTWSGFLSVHTCLYELSRRILEPEKRMHSDHSLSRLAHSTPWI